jgi:hypothetical protein
MRDTPVHEVFTRRASHHAAWRGRRGARGHPPRSSPKRRLCSAEAEEEGRSRRTSPFSRRPFSCLRGAEDRQLVLIACLDRSSDLKNRFSCRRRKSLASDIRAMATDRARAELVTTSVTTSITSDASISSTRPYDLDAPARSGRIYALGYQVEGLLRDNRVEVRVLFGVWSEGPHDGALSFSGHVDAPSGELSWQRLWQMENREFSTLFSTTRRAR